MKYTQSRPSSETINTSGSDKNGIFLSSSSQTSRKTYNKEEKKQEILNALLEILSYELEINKADINLDKSISYHIKDLFYMKYVLNSLKENFGLYFEEEAIEKVKIKDIPLAIMKCKNRGFESFFYDEGDNHGESEYNEGGKDEVIHNKQEETIGEDGNEKVYIEELKSIYSEQSEITDRERRLLSRLSKSLGISEERAKELEDQINPNTLSEKEQEYAEEIKACLEDDGVISDRERRILNRLATSLDITPERAEEIEKIMILNNNK